MCSAFSVILDPDIYRSIFTDMVGPFSEISPGDSGPPVRPFDSVPIVFLENRRFTVSRAIWTICPPWAEGEILPGRTSAGNQTFRWKGRPYGNFNCRAETLSPPGRWRELCLDRPCAVLVRSFREWAKTGKPAEGTDFFLRNHEPMILAGVYSSVEVEGESLKTFSIVTTEANELVRALPHERMPVVLPRERSREWLLPGKKRVEDFFVPYPSFEMEVRASAPPQLSLF